VSRALRDPSREDRDLNDAVGGTTLFLGGGNFQPEQLTAIEIGHPASRRRSSLIRYRPTTI